jgi:hypothetical protein
MIDPAVGRTRAMRALGEAYPKTVKKVAKKKLATTKDIRNTNVGQFAGPKPTYGRYNVSEQAADLLNRSKNKGTR